MKIVATGCNLLRLKCTKFDFGWSLQHSPRPLPGFEGTYFKGEEGQHRGRKGRGREEREGERERGKERCAV